MEYKGVVKIAPMDFLFAYITASGEEEARRIGKVLVEESLAACVNILPGMESWYRWNGKLENSREAVLIAKTRAELRDSLQRRVLELHSYDCPCVVFLPVAGGNPAYLEWLARESREKPD
jgi:periplasmic divalent cation tolerance protein